MPTVGWNLRMSCRNRPCFSASAQISNAAHSGGRSVLARLTCTIGGPAGTAAPASPPPAATSRGHMSVGRPDALHDLAYLRLKAEVEHAIRLVENEVGGRRRLVCRRPEIIEPARRRDHDLDALLQVADLRPFEHAYTHVFLTPEAAPNFSHSPWICSASSRVGASTSAIGPSPACKKS